MIRGTPRGWIEHHLEKEIPVPLDNVAEGSVYFGAKNLMAYAQLCLVARELGRQGNCARSLSDWRADAGSLTIFCKVPVQRLDDGTGYLHSGRGVMG